MSRYIILNIHPVSMLPFWRGAAVERNRKSKITTTGSCAYYSRDDRKNSSDVAKIFTTSGLLCGHKSKMVGNQFFSQDEVCSEPKVQSHISSLNKHTEFSRGVAIWNNNRWRKMKGSSRWEWVQKYS